MTRPQPAEKEASRANELEEIERLVQARDARAAIERATAFRPRDRREQVELERLLSWARYILGDDRASRRHMIRALRGTSRQPALRIHARSNLAELLNRIGEADRAERELHRALAEIHAHGVARSQQPWVLNALALHHRRRGMVEFAIRTYERALASARQPGSEIQGWGSIASNLALAHLQAGDPQKAGRILGDLEDADERVLFQGHRVGFYVTCALHALEAREFETCDESLNRAREHLRDGDIRGSALVHGVRAELAIARGHAARAVTELEEMIRETEEHPTLRDLFSSTARRLASALLDLGAPKQALEKARLAVQRGRGNDVQEWAAGLRVMGRCLAALGRTEEARSTLGEARSILAASECHAERQRLDETLRELGFSAEESEDPSPSRVVVTAPPASSSSMRSTEIRLPLSDGRVFLTCDAELVEAIRGAAGDHLPVLIVGETGTGKELVARLIHEMGASPTRPWVVVDCTTLPESLVEAELFGAAKGAFTGAVTDRAGLVAHAEGGTLFLDELPELAPAVQAKLLRLLQEGTYRRVGESRTRTIHTRIVAATSRDPETLVAAGALRPDLFYRLNGRRIAIPPLRARPQDLRLLANERAREARLKGITDRAFDILCLHTWPGNVRELEMLLRVTSAQAPSGSWLDESAFRHLVPPSTTSLSGSSPGLKGHRRESERDYLRQLIERHGGNIASAAREISMSRQGLHKALRRVGLI